MIHVLCPHCQVKLAVKDAMAGRLGACPKCKGRLRIPQPETITSEDIAEERVTSAPSKSPARRNVEADDDEEDRPRRRRVEEREANDEDEPPRRPRKKRKRRRIREESSSGTADMFGGVHPVWFGLAGLGVLWLICFGLAFVFPPLALVPMGLGYLVSFAGGIWFLVVAFQDDVMQGILCMFVPFYSLYYLVTNFDAAKMPFFTQVLGIVMIVSGICAGSMSGKQQSEGPGGLRGCSAAAWRIARDAAVTLPHHAASLPHFD